MSIRHEKGFTLLEVMISMIVLAIGILGLGLIMSMSIYGNTYSKGVTEANALAQREVESLSNQQSYGTLPYSCVTDSVQGIYQISRIVEDNTTNASVPAGLYKISVVVAWRDQQAVDRTIYYTTFKSVL
jgi:type IV pilus assembly protein PilV